MLFTLKYFHTIPIYLQEHQQDKVRTYERNKPGECVAKGWFMFPTNETCLRSKVSEKRRVIAISRKT